MINNINGLNSFIDPLYDTFLEGDYCFLPVVEDNVFSLLDPTTESSEKLEINEKDKINSELQNNLKDRDRIIDLLNNQAKELTKNNKELEKRLQSTIDEKEKKIKILNIAIEKLNNNLVSVRKKSTNDINAKEKELKIAENKLKNLECKFNKIKNESFEKEKVNININIEKEPLISDKLFSKFEQKRPEQFNIYPSLNYNITKKEKMILERDEIISKLKKMIYSNEQVKKEELDKKETLISHLNKEINEKNQWIIFYQNNLLESEKTIASLQKEVQQGIKRKASEILPQESGDKNKIDFLLINHNPFEENQKLKYSKN